MAGTKAGTEDPVEEIAGSAAKGAADPDRDQDPAPDPDSHPDSDPAPAPDSDSDPEPESAAVPGAGRTRLLGPDPTRTTSIALALVAAVCAAWSGWSWYAAAHDDSLRFSRAREEVLRSGEQAVQNLNTLDYRTVDEGLRLWQDSSTSELYQQIVQGRPQFEQAVAKARTITSAKVLDAAVTELDEHAGKAGVIVALQITVTPPEGDPVIKKTRLVGQLTRTATGWKLSGLGQAPVGTAGS